jgi:hypothetical protein
MLLTLVDNADGGTVGTSTNPRCDLVVPGFNCISSLQAVGVTCLNIYLWVATAVTIHRPMALAPNYCSAYSQPIWIP